MIAGVSRIDLPQAQTGLSRGSDAAGQTLFLGPENRLTEAMVAKITTEYDLERIKTLIANDGWA